MGETRAKATRVDHISIVVEDFDKAYDFYANLLGLEVLKVEESELHGVKAAFLEKHGPGFHHVAFEVPDLPEALEEVADAGVRVLGDPKPGIHGGRIAFLHPKNTQGTMVELCDKKDFEDQGER